METTTVYRSAFAMGSAVKHVQCDSPALLTRWCCYSSSVLATGNFSLYIRFARIHRRPVLAITSTSTLLFVATTIMPHFIAARCYESALCGVMWCLSVRHVRAFCQNEKKKHLQNVVMHRRVHHSVFSTPNVMAIFRRGPPDGGVECRWGR